MDYEFANISESVDIFNFTISPNSTRRFEVTIINDNIAEFWRENIHLGLYVYGLTGVDYIGGVYISIDDDDGE